MESQELTIIDGETIIREKDHCEYIANDTNEDAQYDTMESSDENENFPWLNEFTSLMCSVVENTNYELFEYLLSTYEKNVSKDFCRCFLKPFKSAKLKNHIRNTLNFFHFYWRNVKERVSDDYSYFDKMTEIVRMYLDLEVLTSSKDVNSFDNVSTNILTALHIYLDNSEEHIFKILLKSKYVTNTFSKIYSPIFAKFLSNVKSNAKFITNFRYARYLLAFKLWKKIVDSLDEEKKITDMAVIKLGSSMPNMGSELSKFIPKPPEGHKSGTLWFMQSSLVDFQKACDGFLMLEAKIHSSSFSEEFKEIIINRSDTHSSQLDLENDVQLKSHPEINREVLFIDLTNENEEAKMNTKKQKKKKPQWLKEIKVHHKFKKPQPFSKRRKWIEVADAHSTESCENFEKIRLENVLLSKTDYSFDKSSVCSPAEENIVSSQTTENKANASTNKKTSAEASLTNTCQKCNVTSNTTNKSNTNANLINSNKTLLEDNNHKSSNSRTVHSSKTYVTSVCDNLRSSVLHKESRDILNYGSEDMSSQSGKKLPTVWDNRSDKADVCAVSTTVGDHGSESSSGVWTDYNSADSEAPDIIASPRSEISLNSCKIQQEEVCEGSKLDGPSSVVSDSQTRERIIDVCLSEIVFRTTPTKFDNILSDDMDMEEYQNIFEKAASFPDRHTPSDSLLEGSLGTTGILNYSLLDFDLLGLGSSPNEFLYSMQAIDPNSITKLSGTNDFEISGLFSEFQLAKEEIIEKKEEPSSVNDSSELRKCDVKVNEKPEVVQKRRKGKERMTSEVSSTSRRSERSWSFPSDSEEPFKKERRVQELLPFKKRQEARIIREKNLGVIKRDL